eukprot:TRINITY_DN5880_c0_g1_i2.p2 TRINITY_DN5880_c0_g1~~TRINITY_DN5880_c0_g1_i2.p2  ORF type:complete len:255 (+),score=15.68 TRINITY_DN5880_c0_g1_i2:73-837(+)
MSGRLDFLFAICYTLCIVSGLERTDYSNCTVTNYLSKLTIPQSQIFELIYLIIPTDACEVYTRYGLSLREFKPELQQALQQKVGLTVDFVDFPDDACNLQENVTGIYIEDGVEYEVVLSVRTYARSLENTMGSLYITTPGESDLDNPWMMTEGAFSVEVLESNAPQFVPETFFAVGKFIYLSDEMCDNADCATIVKYQNDVFSTSFGPFFVDRLSLQSEELGNGDMLASFTFDITPTGMFAAEERHISKFCEGA